MSTYRIKVARRIEHIESTVIEVVADDDEEALRKAHGAILASGEWYFTINDPDAQDYYEVLDTCR